MERFIYWINQQHSRRTGGDTNKNNIMLVAHNGARHDHIYFVRTMMKWGIDPPDYLLSDTLALFKAMKRMRENAKLIVLVNRYAPWINHIPYDADSNADALRYVTMVAFPDTKRFCYAFSLKYSEFKTRVGLNMYIPAPSDPFEIHHAYEAAVASPETRMRASTPTSAGAPTSSSTPSRLSE
ncbi:hypothetical protein LTR96_011095 [Exophiala xenobiotica]|nr:hypothetical protein LTR72_011412 [Exophiala xenobiotica]KAK5263511.1 hypothetical protein LTR96_011095 [Exophiala xenobiotica]KAK5284889.1 hypothetical protein LTR14_011419 [Exophiala xenobiotica]KAK5332755.1 hypothetical protein LTR98_011127 [Exophiala xenobiotica]KAK5469028.1 hypothetical protein LTR55_011434 [Exophiala xenobiotica]